MRKRQQSGQSAVLLGFLILVIVGMVGLSVDVGNAYGQQRRVQSISNAGAMAAMASVLTNNTNNGVWTEVQRVVASNRALNNSNYTYTVDYILDDGTVDLLGEWNGSMAYIPNGNSYPPSNIVRIQMTMTENVPTYFAGVVGRKNLGVAADGVACLGNYGYGVYPLGVPLSLHPPRSNSPGHDIYFSNGTKLPYGDARWGQWGAGMQGMTIRIPVTNKNSEFASGTHISWLNWGGDTQIVDGVRYEELKGLKGTSALDEAFTEPGTLHKGFLEAISPDSSKPNIRPMKSLQRGDWINGDPGVRASLEDELAVLKAKETMLILPMYDAVGGGSGSKTSYHVANMGSFLIRAAEFNGGTKYIDLVYLGDANASPAECGSEAAAGWGKGGNKQFNVKGEVKTNNRVWRTWSSGSTTYDIVIVMDTSQSMRYDWYDRDTNESGYSGARMIDAKKAVTDFVKGYDVSPTTGDPDARIAFVTFGGTAPGKYDITRGTTPQGFNPAPVQVGWSTACASTAIANDCNGTSNKWAPIQTKASAMTAVGVTPGPIAFEVVETLLQQKRTPPTGKKYEQIVIFATDGVFNVCGRDSGEKSCPYGEMVPADGSAGTFNTNPEYYLNNPNYNSVSGRPIWQAQQVANRIRNSGARIFMVALTPTCLAADTDCFEPAGLMDMSNGANYYYQANDASAMANLYATIRQRINADTCVPREITQQAANATVLLTKPDNPTWRMQTMTDSSGAFQFSNLAAGQYIVKVDPALTIKSPEDGLSRTYSRIRNGRSLSEERQASVYINPQFPNGATVSTQLLLSLPIGNDGTPHNGCTMPTP